MNGSSYELIFDIDKIDELSKNIVGELSEQESILDNISKIVSLIPDNFQGNISDEYVNSFNNYLSNVKKMNKFNTDLVTLLNKNIEEYSTKEVEFVGSRG